MINANQPTLPVTPKPVPSLPDLLEEIEQRANAATPGPWHWNGVGYLGSEYRAPINLYADENAFFIAAARSDVPKLVKALRRAVEYIENQGTDSEGYLYPGAEHALNSVAQLLSDQREDGIDHD